MNPRILLVEDDPTSRAFLSAATETLPAQVECAASIAEAIDRVAAGTYDLWLIDANLPDGHGSVLLSRLRAGGSTTPAIAHTASHEPDEHQALRSAGFAATIAKPLPAAEWVRAIAAVLPSRANRRLGEPAPPRSAGMPDAPAAADAQAPAPVWDDGVALAALGGHAGHVAAMRTLFLDELPATRLAIAGAVATGDAGAVASSLHKLRAGCGFVGALRLDAAAACLRADPLSPEALARFEQAAQDTLSSS